jgi:AcrR family transcriptional regulator
VFFESGFHRATVDSVAERAEVSKGTVYLYFQSKETILAHLLLDGLDELAVKLKLDYAAQQHIPADERMRQLGRAYRRFFEDEPQYFRLLMAMDRGRFQETVTPEVYQQVLEGSMEVFDVAVRAIEQGIEDELFNCPDPRGAAVVLWATLNGLLELLAHPLRRKMVGIEPESLYEGAFDMLIQSLQTAPDSEEVRE